jgi:hypothetical protein
MDEQRRKIITSEINYWKQNRMLPEHYCNFLLNLYTEGGSGQAEPTITRFFPLSKLLTLFMLGLLSLSIFLFYFTELSLILQTALMIIFGISSLITAGYLISKSFFEVIPLLASALVLLLTTVNASEILFPDKAYVLFFVTAVNCLLWLAAGMKWNLVSFKISGIAGLIILFITIFI